MQLYKCRCGKHTAHSTVPIADCMGCEKCGTTIEYHPSLYRAIQPHTWQTVEINSETVDQCIKCHRIAK